MFPMKNFLKSSKEKKPKQKIKWSLLGRIWREIGRPYWKWLLLGVVFTILTASAEGYTIMLVQRVIDVGFVENNMDLLLIIGLQIVAAFSIKGISRYSRAMIMAKTGIKMSTKLQQRIYRHTIRTDVAQFNKDGIARFQNHFGVQAGSVLGLFTNQITHAIQDIATLIIMFGLMLWFAPQMVAVLVFMIPAIFIPFFLIMHQKKKLTRASFGIANSFGQQMNQSLYGMKTIQAFGMEDYETERFSKVLKQAMDNGFKQARIGELRSPIMEMSISIGLCMSLLMAGHFIATGAISIGDFTAFLLALTTVYKPAKNINGIGDGIQHAMISAETLYKFLDTEPTIRDSKNAIPLSGGRMDVEFKNVSFAYNEADGNVLSDVDLKVPAGATCAFVGPSGGGKTTMFNLLERFYEPNTGAIFINGRDIRDYTLASLRRNIAEVSQDVFLFNGTVRDNIKYGSMDATDEQVIEAAKTANAHDFIMKMPNGYDTAVGERGTLVSGGQKQRLAIARAILKNAPILLLDEATSALDTESERLIQASLEKLMVGRTVFVIAHRLSTILDADQINVISRGRIIERGTDAELSAANGEYRKLRDIQFASGE